MTIRFSLPVLFPALALALCSTSVQAAERNNAVAGAIIGSAAGAVIGHHISGRDGALVGGALGAVTGVAVATADRRASGRDDYIYDGDADDRVVYRERPRYEAPVVRERVVYREAPVVVYRPVPVYYQPVRQVVRYEYAGWRRDHRGWDRRYAAHDGGSHPGRGHAYGHDRDRDGDRGHGRGRGDRD